VCVFVCVYMCVPYSFAGKFSLAESEGDRTKAGKYK